MIRENLGGPTLGDQAVFFEQFRAGDNLRDPTPLNPNMFKR